MSQNKINILLDAIEDNPADPFPHFALAREYQKIGNRASAGKHYQHLIDHFPDYGGTYYHYALFLIEESPEKAQSIISKGLTVLQNSGDTNLYNELAALRDQYL